MSNAQINEDRLEASKELFAFMDKYVSLVELQLRGIKERMAVTVEDIMASINDLNSKAENRKKMASSVLVKKEKNTPGKLDIQGEDSQFKNVSAKDLSVSGSGDDSAQAIGEGAINAGVKFKEYMSALPGLDSNVQEALFMMMGTLSNDDVVGQKLQHVGEALHSLKDGMQRIIGLMNGKFQMAEVEPIATEIKDKMFKQYTTEDEKDLFRKVFK